MIICTLDTVSCHHGLSVYVSMPVSLFCESLSLYKSLNFSFTQILFSTYSNREKYEPNSYLNNINITVG